MRLFLFLGSLIAGAWGCLVLAMAKSAIHEIQSYMMFLIAAVLFSSSAIIDAIMTIRKDFSKSLRSTNIESDHSKITEAKTT